MYVGYKYQLKGYDVSYHGIEKGMEDLGRDLVMTKKGQTLIVQCKYWSNEKVIREKHILQLYGTYICYCIENHLLIASICAAPSILGHKGLLNGINAVCFPGFEGQLVGANVSNDAVMTDKNFVTACGAGAAVKFGLEIIKYIEGEASSKHMAKTILCDR
jgi:putative intracellular protease/amidase